MDVEVQYVEGCPNWLEARVALREALVRAGCAAQEIRSVQVRDAEHAHALGFLGSPSIVVDGRDLFADAGPDAAATEGRFACRLYVTPAGRAGAPTVEQVVDALAVRAR